MQQNVVKPSEKIKKDGNRWIEKWIYLNNQIMTIKSQLLEFLNSKTVTGVCVAKHLKHFLIYYFLLIN